MSEPALQISLDSTSTFESLVPYRDHLVAAEDGASVALQAELAEDTPSAVVFGLAQLLHAAVRDGKVKSDDVVTLKDIGPFGAVYAKTGFANAPADQA